MKSGKPAKPLPKVGGVAEYLSALKSSPRYGPQVIYHKEIAEKRAIYKKPKKPWPADLSKALDQMGIKSLYSHQAAAVDLIRQGDSIIIATPTASGKSLVYNLPVFEKIFQKPETKALYLFPLKALAQDQLKAVQELAGRLPEEQRPTAAILDGDTSSYRRKKIRETLPNILISNPDMLHLSMLGYHENWSRFWSGLTHVIMDEAHTYRGVFGTHMAWVVRRLRRICGFFGTDPQFVLSSATIGNPAQLANDLLGMPVKTIIKTGAPEGRRHFVFIDPYESAGYAASRLLEAALKRGLRTIVYTQSRKMTELISVWTKPRLGDIRDKLSSYRAGFLPEERREIEGRLTSGELLGVVSTSALELGIDIGSLDICILVGYPGTIMQTWQRSGRVGRRQRESLVALIAQEDALDQYFMRNPEDFFDRDIEDAVLNPDNSTIMKQHLVCAAAERPISINDPLIKSRAASQVMREMAEKGTLLLGDDGREWFTIRKYPHRKVNLRGSGKSYSIRKSGDRGLLGEIDGNRCLKECHPGAVYLHRGKTWVVTDLDLEAHEVTVVPRDVNYFTQPLGNKQTEILKVYKSVTKKNFRASMGYLRVTESVTGFQKRLKRGLTLISTEQLDLPPMIFETEGLWIEIPKQVQDRLEQGRFHFMGGIHAMEHVSISIFPLLVLCDRNDVGGIAIPFHPQLRGAAVFIYDGYPGGVGLSRQAFGRIEELLCTALKTINTCPCEVGCPSCVHSPKCGSGNRPIDKEAARRVLDGLLTPGDVRPEPARVTGLQAPAPASTDRETAQLPKRYGVFDLETRKSAQEVGGWHRADRMGISVAVLYDSELDEYITFREHDIPDLVEHLKRLDLVVGFNNKRFDNMVLSAYTSFDLNRLPTLDILEEVKNRLGYRLSLDHLGEQTLNAKKSANGLMALKWYKQGRIDKIIEYCKKDVEITKDIFLFGFRNQYLLFKNKAGKKVRCPVRFDASL